MIKYSIIIPTADRHYLLQHTLRACLTTQRDDVEIIVSDNFSTPETRSVIDAYQHDKRLRYFRTDRRMSMPEHWDFAWAKARGQFVIINCDDDLLLPSGLDAIDRVIEAFAPQILSWDMAQYFHPDYDAEGSPNTLFLPVGHSGLQLSLDTPQIIAAYGRFDFRYFPEGTHFCISRELGEAVMRRTGRLFWAPSPDFSAPLLLLAAAETGRYCYIDSVLGFGGRSKHSNAAAFTRSAERSSRVDEFHAEFSNQDDLFPHHSLRLPLYYNSYLAPVSLLRKFYPECAVDVDMFRFFSYAYEELFGIRYNPLVTASMEQDLGKYIDQLPAAEREAAARARREVLRSWKWRPSNQLVRKLAPRFVRNAIKELLGLTRMHIKVSGGKEGFSNSFELANALDRIIQKNDRFSLARINEVLRENLALSVHRIGSGQKAAQLATPSDHDAPWIRGSRKSGGSGG